MAEVAPAGGGGPNRMFLVIALGLVGLLIIGVIAIGGIFLLQQVSRPAVVPTATVRVAIATATRVLVMATLFPTDTPTQAATPTRVVQPAVTGGDSTPVITTTVTVTATVGTGTPGAGLPQTGIGEDLLLLAAGVVLVLVIFAARRARATGAA